MISVLDSIDSINAIRIMGKDTIVILIIDYCWSNKQGPQKKRLTIK